MRVADLPKDQKGEWFRKHPEAKKFLEVWLDMSAKGASDFTFTRFFREVLRDLYDFPWRNVHATAKWMRKVYGDTYEKATTARRRR